MLTDFQNHLHMKTFSPTQGQRSSTVSWHLSECKLKLADIILQVDSPVYFLSLIFSFTAHCDQAKEPRQVGNGFNFKAHTDSNSDTSSYQSGSLCELQKCSSRDLSSQTTEDELTDLHQSLVFDQFLLCGSSATGEQDCSFLSSVRRSTFPTSLNISGNSAQPTTLKAPLFIWIL